MKISSLTPDLRGGRLGPLVRNGSSVTSSRHFQLSGLHSCSSVLWLHATKNLGTSVCFRRISPCNFALETSLTQFSDNGDSSVFWSHQIFIIDSWSSIYRQYRKVKEKKQDDKCQEISLQNLTRTLKIIKKKNMLTCCFILAQSSHFQIKINTLWSLLSPFWRMLTRCSSSQNSMMYKSLIYILLIWLNFLDFL